MAETIEELKQVLADARARLNAVLDAASSRVDEQVYGDGLQWNVRQIAIHLADADRGQNRQVMAFAEGRELIPADFDLQRYNRRTIEKGIEISFAEARQSLVESRTALHAWLETIDEATLDKTGRHTSLKVMTIRDVLKTMAEHERDHADDIARALGIPV